jgi:hypothetical protein
VNFWRHFAVVAEGGRVGLFYNAGEYFREKLFLKVSAEPARGKADGEMPSLA